MKNKNCLKFLILLVAIMLIPITSQAASQKSQVKNTVKAYFKYMKKYDVKNMNKYAYGKKYKIAQIKKCESKSIYNYIKKHNKKITYSIKSVSVKNKNATVKMNVRYVDSTNLGENVVAYMFVDAFSGVYTESNEYLNKLFSKSIKASKVKMKTRSITVKLQKKNGKWKIKSDLSNIACADINRAIEAAIDKFNEEMSGE